MHLMQVFRLLPSAASAAVGRGLRAIATGHGAYRLSAGDGRLLSQCVHRERDQGRRGSHWRGSWDACNQATPGLALLGALGMLGSSVSECFLGGAGAGVSKSDAAAAELLKEADAMYAKGNRTGVRKLLEGSMSSENPEVLWRLARAYYDTAEESKSATKLDKKRLCEKAFEVIESALSRGDDNFAVHKWYGIILNKLSGYQGTSASIEKSFIVRQHWEKAAELNPADPTSCSLLGEWCFAVAGISGFTRTLAATIFAKPPTSNYEVPLLYFISFPAPPCPCFVFASGCRRGLDDSKMRKCRKHGLTQYSTPGRRRWLTSSRQRKFSRAFG